MTRTKKDLVKAVRDYAPDVSLADATRIVNGVLAEILTRTIQNDRFELRGFGIFSRVREFRANRHNPKTGEKVPAPDTFKVHYKPGALARRIDPKTLCPQVTVKEYFPKPEGEKETANE